MSVDAGVPVETAIERRVELAGREVGVRFAFNRVGGFVGIFLLDAAEREFGEAGGEIWSEHLGEEENGVHGKLYAAADAAYSQLNHAGWPGARRYIIDRCDILSLNSTARR